MQPRIRLRIARHPIQSIQLSLPRQSPFSSLLCFRTHLQEHVSPGRVLVQLNGRDQRLPVGVPDIVDHGSCDDFPHVRLTAFGSEGRFLNLRTTFVLGTG